MAWLLVVALLASVPCMTLGLERIAAESRLRADLLLGGKSFLVAPVEGEHKPVTVKLDASLTGITRVDPANSQIELLLMTQTSWRDTRLQWNPAAYSNISQLHLDPSTIWRPDVVVYEQTEPAVMIYPDIELILRPDGEILYVPSIKYRVFCDLSGLDTREGAMCSLKFSSWTRNGFELDLEFRRKESVGFDLSNYFFDSVPDQQYHIVNTTAQRHVVLYACCVEPFVDLQYTITIRSRDWSSFFGWF